MAAGQTRVVSALHDEIVSFVERLQCSELETRHREEAIRRLVAVVNAAHDHAANIQVVVFGSQASGLASHTSDIDILIEGICSSNIDGCTCLTTCYYKASHTCYQQPTTRKSVPKPSRPCAGWQATYEAAATLMTSLYSQSPVYPSSR